MQIVVLLLTVVILAILGQAMRNNYWLIPLVPVGAVWLAYRLSSPYEKREFRVAIPRVLRYFRLRPGARRRRLLRAKQLQRSAALRLHRDD